MSLAKTIKVFILSNKQEVSKKVQNYLRQYASYKIYFLPEYISEFELMKFEPDIIIKDQNVDKVIHCSDLNLIPSYA